MARPRDTYDIGIPPAHLRPGAPLGGEFDIIRKPFTQAELAAAFSKLTDGSANATG